MYIQFQKIPIENLNFDSPIKYISNRYEMICQLQISNFLLFSIKLSISIHRYSIFFKSDIYKRNQVYKDGKEDNNNNLFP